VSEMPAYYNRTRSVLAVSLPDGTSTVVVPKGTLAMPTGGTTESIARLVRKGALVLIGLPDAARPESPSPSPENDGASGSSPEVTAPVTASSEVDREQKRKTRRAAASAKPTTARASARAEGKKKTKKKVARRR